MYGYTDGRTDRPSYRDACTHLKIDKEEKRIHFRGNEEEANYGTYHINCPTGNCPTGKAFSNETSFGIHVNILVFK